MLAILYDNFWYTNFQGDSPGVMEFQFDFAWRQDRPEDAAVFRLAEALTTEPSVVINPALPESPTFIERLFRP